ncbi:hypothetical protein GLOIN_2v1886648 [Rhizophagus clarus]|uniref:CxC1-like cysteine cluster associated with KDZ transposases domain-containing protein n=1 Tax=Rhizophagus clarus TaxID=94130 RepID=A0A8H3KSS3_9GLOM|nr:hypothetical protein GLOIN_2v1886648 [Rhizophagus clarus]
MSENSQPSFNKKSKGPIKYRPYSVSNNKRNSGKTIVNKYAKGKAKFDSESANESNKSSEFNDTIDNEYMEIDENVDCYLPLFHEKKQKYLNDQISLTKNWESISETIFKGIIKSQGFFEKSPCIKCKKEAFLKCLDCGPNVYFCNECDRFFHDVINIFHRRIIKNNQVTPIKITRLPQICLEKECKHEIIKVLCVDIKEKYNIELSICNGLIESLIYNKLFPSSPIRPTIVFTFDLLDFYKQLLCEAQVSYLAFCKILENFHMNKNITRNIYFSFISAFQHYIDIKSKINEEVSKLYQETKFSFNCPACSQPQEDNAKLIIAFDGNFQLRRLKSAGNNISNRLVINDYIKTFDEYQDWVKQNYNSINNNQIFNKNKNNITFCESNFKAADQYNSYHKSKSLDDTGLFGCTCRHGIPIKFINLRNIGERYSLAECLISELNNLFPKNSQSFIILYDIACSLHTHVMNNSSSIHSLKSKLNWGVSIFHAYAHSIKCQLKYHPRVQKDIGLTDGESLERIWSYLEVTNKLLVLKEQHNVTEEIIKNFIKKQDEHIYENERWNPMDIKYIQYLNNYAYNQIENIIDKIRILRNEYLFKSGYLFDHNHKGHKTAIKVKNSISDIIKKIDIQIILYSEMRLLLSYEILHNYPELSINHILDHKSDLWKILDLNTEDNCGISRIILYNAIQNYNNLNRAKEEQNMIPQELSRLLTYWNTIKINIENKLNEFNDEHTLLMNGFMYNLKHILFKVNNIIENCNSIKIQIENMQNNFYQDENNLTNENTYIFINESEEIELLEGKLSNNNITELDEDNENETNIKQKYKSNIIDKFDEFNLSSSDSEVNDI